MASPVRAGLGVCALALLFTCAAAMGQCSGCMAKVRTLSTERAGARVTRGAQMPMPDCPCPAACGVGSGFLCRECKDYESTPTCKHPDWHAPARMSRRSCSDSARARDCRCGYKAVNGTKPGQGCPCRGCVDVRGARRAREALTRNAGECHRELPTSERLRLPAGMHQLQECARAAESLPAAVDLGLMAPRRRRACRRTSARGPTSAALSPSAKTAWYVCLRAERRPSPAAQPGMWMPHCPVPSECGYSSDCMMAAVFGASEDVCIFLENVGQPARRARSQRFGRCVPVARPQLGPVLRRACWHLRPGHRARVAPALARELCQKASVPFGGVASATERVTVRRQLRRDPTAGPGRRHD
jgi:hypothetical protein